MNRQPRRQFLKRSLGGITAAALLPGYVSNSISTSGSNGVYQDNLSYRQLGKTGIKLPVISMGTSNINEPSLILEAMDRGIKLFTTSSYYREGNNETMLGSIIKNRPRDSFLIATGSMPQGVDNVKGIYTDTDAPKQYKSDIEGGLKRLGLDYLDIIFLTFGAKRESILFEPFMRMMEDFKKQGKCRFIGVTTHSFCDEAVRAAVDAKIYDLVVPAYNFRSENVTALDDAIKYAKDSGVGIMSMKAQAGGFWDKERKEPVNSRAAIKWALQNENIASVVSGMSTREQLDQNIKLMSDLRLDEKERNDLRLASDQKLPGIYCQQCNRCIPQCPQSYNIPVAMRSFMYAYGYRDIRYAKETLGYSDLPADPCGNCGNCNVDCTMGFNIREKIKDIARLRNVPDEFITTRKG